MSAFRYSAWFSVAFASISATGGIAAATQNCLFQLTPPEESVVLGSFITSQSNYLVIDSCSKSIDAVRANLLEPAREQAEAALDERERRRRVREEGDRLTQLRDASIKAEIEKQEAEGGWFSWLWRGGT